MASISALTELAFHRGPARRANELIDQVRREVAESIGHAVSYEVVVSGRSWDYVEQVVAPRLAFFLRTKRYSVKRCAPVFVSLFAGETLYFLRPPDLFHAVRQAKGLDEAAFNVIVQSWEEHGRAALAALPPARGPN